MQLEAWVNNSGERREVTKSYYDFTVLSGLPANFTPNPLTQRKRITHVTYEEAYDGNDQTYDHATHYDYDIHEERALLAKTESRTGSSEARRTVKTLLQDNRKMATEFPSIASQRYKRMDYSYDLVSGNVHRMSVQTSEADQWHHAYKYDADNRIISAHTNTGTPLIQNAVIAQYYENELTQNTDWQQEAKYIYYDHGPLARVELGTDGLQGIDYVYNLQGWLKGVNATSLDENIDPGKDALTGSVNAPFAKDVYAFGLQYFEGDYAPIGAGGTTPNITQLPQASINASSHAAQNPTTNDLFNGNIRFMQVSLTDPATHNPMPMLNSYQYDQLNRLLESRSYEEGLANNEWNTTSYNNAYYNAFTYDGMGNILTQKRHKRDGTQIEDMTYRYKYDATGKLLRNRLYHINDAIASNADATDIDDMGTFEDNPNLIEIANNNVRDEEGRLIKNVQEEIEQIVWRVDGKVKDIIRTPASQKKNVSFDYDAMGNQVAKHITNNQTGLLEYTTYYVLDAQGNQLNVYKHEVSDNEVNYLLEERHIYASSHVGTLTQPTDMYASASAGNSNTIPGYKLYSLSDHRGNVNTVISDVKVPLADDGVTVSGYQAYIVNIADFSPFNVELDGRTQKNAFYRYSVQAQEHHDEVLGEGNFINYKYRGYDPRIGRLDWMIDPLARKFAHNSTYAFSENRVIDGVELEGLEYVNYIYKHYANGTVKQFTYFYDSKNHNNYGPKGMGYTITHKYYDSYNKEITSKTTSKFVERATKLPFLARGIAVYDYIDYGVYLGSGSSPKNQSLPAIDMTDEAARQHDAAYDAIGAVGRNSLDEDWGTTYADAKAIQEWADVSIYYDNGWIDPVSGNKVNKKQLDVSNQSMLYFSYIVNNKIEAISEFMSNEFGSSKMGVSNHSSDKGAQNTNFALFMKTYMTLNEETGFYERKNEYWNKDGGSYTPKSKEDLDAMGANY